MQLERLIGELGFAEGPRWHRGRLWFSDFGDRVVRAVDLHGGVTQILGVDKSPSGLGWLPDDSLLVVSMGDHRVLRVTDDGVVEHANLASFAKFRSNDMVVDARGNAYVGHMGFDLLARPAQPAPASLIKVSARGDVQVAATDLLFPNGVVIGNADRCRDLWAAFDGIRCSA
jgi:sugar lactone lactonase YvrE